MKNHSIHKMKKNLKRSAIKKIIALYLSIIICLTNNIGIFAEGLSVNDEQLSDIQIDTSSDTDIEEVDTDITLKQFLIWSDNSKIFTLSKKNGSCFFGTDSLSFTYLDGTDRPENEIVNIIAEIRHEDKANYTKYEILKPKLLDENNQQQKMDQSMEFSMDITETLDENTSVIIVGLDEDYQIIDIKESLENNTYKFNAGMKYLCVIYYKQPDLIIPSDNNIDITVDTITDNSSDTQLDLDLSNDITVNDKQNSNTDSYKADEESIITPILEEDSSSSSINTLSNTEENKIQENIQNDITVNTIISMDTGTLDTGSAETSVLNDETVANYAILYDDGELVFQNGSTPDNTKGNVIGIYDGFETDKYYGVMPPWYENKDLILNVSFKDSISPTCLVNWFKDCTNLISVNVQNLDLSSANSLEQAFYGCVSLESVLNADSLDVSQIVDIARIFYNCKNLSNINTSTWTFTSLQKMNAAFYNCSSLQSLDTSNWGLDKLKSMKSAFQSCTSLMFLDVTNWHLDNLESMDSTFYGCTVLTGLDTSNWNLSHVVIMANAFRSCEAITDLDGSNWGLERVESMECTFYKCRSLRNINTSGWDLSSLKTMANLFFHCRELLNINTSSWNLSALKYMDYAFNECKSLTVIDGSNWGLQQVTSMYATFEKDENLISINTSGWNLSNLQNMYHTFGYCSGLTELDTSDWNLTNVTNLGGAFYQCSELRTLGDMSGWNLINVVNMKDAFYYCSKLDNIDASTWDVSNVTTLSRAFYHCDSLTTLNTENWVLNSLTDMYAAFYSCMKLQALDSSKWGLNNLLNMKQTFDECKSLSILDTADWNLLNVENMYRAFAECNNLTSIDSKNWNLKNVTNIGEMYVDCYKLQEIDASTWDLSNVQIMEQIFYKCIGLNTLKLGPQFKFMDEYVSLPGEKWMRTSTFETYSPSELYAVYDGNIMSDTYVKPINIIFEGNGGKPNPEKLEGFIGMIPEELPTATWKGGNFDGWYTEIIGGTKLEAGAPIEQKAYYAHWTEYTYNLILKSVNKNNDEKTITLKYSDCYQLSDKLFTNDDMILAGWNTRKDGTGESYEPNEEIRRLSDENGGNIYLYAQWEPKETMATITFDSNGGNEIASKTMKIGSTVGILPDAKKDGYIFEAWHIDAPDGDVISKDTIIEKDIILYASYKANPIVTFNSNGGGPATIQRRVRYNQPVGDLPEYKPNSIRYCSMMGWYTESDGGEKVTRDYVVTEDVTFYAHWGWKPKFNTNGGKIVSDEEFPVQTESVYKINTLPTVVKDGYIFEGWYLADGVTQVNNGEVIDLKNGIDIEAHWKRNDIVTITLDPNGGLIHGSKKIRKIMLFKENQKFTIPFPKKNGYTFVGWEKPDGTIYAQNDIFDADVTLTAQYKQNIHNVTFSADLGEKPYTKIVNIADGEHFDSIPGVKKTNYILEGWYTGQNGQGEKLTTDTIINSDVTYYANWLPFLISNDSQNIEYSYGVEWGNASNENVDNVNGNLDFHPTDDASQTAVLHIRFEINKALNNASLPVGAVKITIPKYIWKDWDGNYIGKNNISANLPEYPEVNEDLLFSYIDDGENYILVNSKNMSSSLGVELNISYQVSPWEVNGGAVDEYGNYVKNYDYFKNTVPVTFTVDNEIDGINDLIEQKELTLEMHTTVDSESSKVFRSVLYDWDSEWGEKPDDFEEYFYVKWICADTITSNTNQPYYITFDENTVHDGTVVYQSKKRTSIHDWSGTSESIIVTKHPISQLENAPSTGLKLDNQVIITEHWKSGYETSRIAHAETSVYYAKYYKGEFDKDNSYGYQYLFEGGQEDIVDDKNNIELKWHLYYLGNSNVSDPIWDENMSTYSVKERTIRIKDGNPGDVMYSSGAPDAKYVWEPITGNISLSDEDYCFSKLQISLTEYDARQENGIWSDPYVHEDIQTTEGVEIYVRAKHSSNFEYFKTIYPGQDYITCELPKDTVGFEIRHDTDFYSTKLSVIPYMSIKPTSKLCSLFEDDIVINKTSLIKNTAVCDIWETEKGESSIYFHGTNYKGGNNPANKEVYELNVSETMQHAKKTASGLGNVILNPKNGTQDTPISISGWNYNTSNRKKYIKQGEFYDLLPLGTTVNENSIFGIPITENISSQSSSLADKYDDFKESSDKLDVSMYDIRFIENWQDSKRTMMVIKFSIPNNIQATGVNFFYLLHNTYENVIANGTTMENDMAFINTTPVSVKPTYKYGGINVLTDKKYFTSLLNDNEDFISFAEASTNYSQVDAFSWGYNKTVKTLTDYVDAANVLPGCNYTYKLSYSQSEDAVSKNIIFYDILENGYEQNGSITQSEWAGQLQDININSISNTLTKDSLNIYCKPVIYYSTKPKIEFTEDDFDISNANIWSTSVPTDLSTVTAIAVDCSKCIDDSDFILKGNKALEVYITMKAPSDETLSEKSTYNSGVVSIQREKDTETIIQHSNAKVTLKNYDVQINKNSAPISGDASNPKTVFCDDSIVYTLNITNNDNEFSINDVIVEDIIPNGLNIDTGNIKVYFDNENEKTNVAESPRVSIKKTGQSLIFNFSSILAGETAHLEIPTIVTVMNGTIENTASIKSVNGIDHLVISDTTYHKAIPVGLSIIKVDTDNKPLSGAIMQLLDSNGIVVKQWMSSSETEIVEVKPGIYTVHEVSTPPGYLMASDIIVNVSDSGVVTVNNKRTDIIKMIDERGTCSMIVSKIVEGNMGNKNKEFTFSMNLKGKVLPAELSYKKGEETGKINIDESSNAIFHLSDGEEIVISDIPIGAEYTITEIDGKNQGYTVKSTNASGTADEGIKISFINTRNLSIPTGGMTNTMIMIILSISCIAAIILLIIKRKRNI